jgi:hypothetical protein
MSDIPKIPAASAETGRYFKMQIRGWTDFDPIPLKLSEITDAIEQGGGFLTAVEVLEVKDDLSGINDNVVREGFQNILAARRILRSIDALPPALIEDLRAALNGEVRKKAGASETPEPVATKRAG